MRRPLPTRLLAGVVAAIVTVATPLAAQDELRPVAPPGPAVLSANQALAREVYREMVQTNTVDSVGSVTVLAEKIAKRFRAAGFPAKDIHLLVPPGKPTKGNLIVRYRGRAGAGGPKPIMLLAHLDVVAANRADWPRDPFVLHEADGYFLGRGTADDKAMAAIFVANLLKWKREGWVPERDLILALTSDEEGGEANGVEWLLANHRALIDAEYAINEGGGGTLQGDTPIFHAIQAAEKVPVNFTLTTRNPGGHSSQPRRDNAIYQLVGALDKVARYRFPVALNAVTRAFFEQTARVERPEVAAAMRALLADPADSAADALLSRDPRYNSTLRTTCVATRLLGGHAYNALPQTATANVNCRIVPTSTLEEVQAELVRVIGDRGVQVTLTVPTRERFGAAPSPVEPALLRATTELTTAQWGGIPVVPLMSTGATDGRFLRAAGIETYGVSGLFSNTGETNSHGRDEKMRVRSFYEGLEFLDKLVQRVAGGAPRS
ncbi:MAG: M20/M25/M40 family metallo-hydrolase [Gemmatimonadales bacterium]|nr:M20/M25/M40 family metallo-hydrolase [Gemmatimonadales bacterium]